MEKVTDEAVNKAIHKKVMGKCWHEISIGCCDHCRLPNHVLTKNPNYCKSIKDAFDAVKAMEAKAGTMLITFDRDYGDEKKTGWQVYIDGAGSGEFYNAPARAIAHAIFSAITGEE